jgi:hypothetical protein
MGVLSPFLGMTLISSMETALLTAGVLLLAYKNPFS